MPHVGGGEHKKKQKNPQILPNRKAQKPTKKNVFAFPPPDLIPLPPPKRDWGGRPTRQPQGFQGPFVQPWRGPLRGAPGGRNLASVPGPAFFLVSFSPRGVQQGAIGPTHAPFEGWCSIVTGKSRARPKQRKTKVTHFQPSMKNCPNKFAPAKKIINYTIKRKVRLRIPGGRPNCTGEGLPPPG